MYKIFSPLESSNRKTRIIIWFIFTEAYSSKLNEIEMKRYERMAHFFYSWSRALFICVGHDIYCVGGFKPNLYTFYTWFIIFMFMISAIYTCVFYDWFTRLNVIGIFAAALEASIKLIFSISLEHFRINFNIFSIFFKVNDENLLLAICEYCRRFG